MRGGMVRAAVAQGVSLAGCHRERDGRVLFHEPAAFADMTTRACRFHRTTRAICHPACMPPAGQKSSSCSARPTRRVRAFATLRHLYALATRTGALRNFYVFGSFVSALPQPRDVDVV